ncbi:MAG: HlyD family secretion protein [Altererythrobacter sp.]
MADQQDVTATVDAADETELEVTTEAQGSGGSPWKRRLAMAIVPLLLVAVGAYFWLDAQGKISTDNAFIKQDMTTVSALVGGTIVEVAVGEGDRVKAGDLLFRLDPEPFAIQLRQADAAIAAAQADRTALANSSKLTGVSIASAREDIAFAEADFERKRALMERGFLTKVEYEAAQHRVAQARESLRLAFAEQSEAQAKLATGPQVPGVYPAVAAARAQREAAQLNLSRTEIRAPSAGRVSQADRLQLGQELIAGLPALTLVDTRSTYVEANFKETDIGSIRAGQKVRISVDAFPDVEFKGRVMSIGGGTGSEFSVLPAQNATGNWVKVTQRVPVRIALDGKVPVELVAGLSAKVTIYIDGKRD